MIDFKSGHLQTMDGKPVEYLGKVHYREWHACRVGDEDNVTLVDEDGCNLTRVQNTAFIHDSGARRKSARHERGGLAVTHQSHLIDFNSPWLETNDGRAARFICDLQIPQTDFCFVCEITEPDGKRWRGQFDAYGKSAGSWPRHNLRVGSAHTELERRIKRLEAFCRDRGFE